MVNPEKLLVQCEVPSRDVWIYYDYGEPELWVRGHRIPGYVKCEFFRDHATALIEAELSAADFVTLQLLGVEMHVAER